MANGHGGARPGSGRKSDAEIAQLRTMIASVMTDDDWIQILSEIVKDARYGNLRSVSFLLALRYGVSTQSLTAPDNPDQPPQS